MEYEIIIHDTSHLVFNIKEDNLYKKCGGNLIGCLVVKTEDLDEKYPHPKKKYDEFSDLYFHRMLDSALCFSDKDIKLFLKKYDNKLKHTSDYFYLDWKTKKTLPKKYTGIKLLVEEIEIIDVDGMWEDEPDYDTKNDLFNPKYYDPDEWEFILKVKKVL